MKFQIFLLFGALLFCSCQANQPVRTNYSNTVQNIVTEEIVNKQSNSEKLAFVGNSKFSTLVIKRIDQKTKFSLKINIEYPKLKMARNLGEHKFNSYVKKRVDAQIIDFTKFLLDKNNDVNSKLKDEYEINLDYEIEYVSNNFISVLMNWNGYSGYLNEDYFPSTINFDLCRGKPMVLSDLFEPNSKYLEHLSELSIEKLNRTCLSCPCKDGTQSGKPLSEGTKNETVFGIIDLKEAVSAKEENFNNWSITSEGLKITFNEYQVGPGCTGIIDVIHPYKLLKPILKKDLNFS